MSTVLDDEQLDKVLSALTDMIYMQNAHNVAIRAGMSEIASAIHGGLSEIAEAVRDSKGQ